MYLLYLDDSGSVQNKDEDYFVLAGVCVHERSVRWLSNEIERVALDICPEHPDRVEFHAADIFSGRDFPWDGIKNKQDRIDIICRVLRIINRTFEDTVVFGCAVHKNSGRHDPVLYAFEQVSNRFDRYVELHSTEKHIQKGLIIVDNTSYEQGLQALAASFRRSGNRWGRQLRAICEIPLFVDSRASRIVQLADHIAYGIFRRYNANDLNYFNCFEGRFFQENGIIHSLVHFQTFNRDCSCPACITRRDRSFREGSTNNE